MTAGSAVIPQWVEKKIELERRRLNQVSAVLKCLRVAFNEDEEVDFGDVAMIAYDIVDSVIAALDSVMLKRTHAGDRDSESD